MYALIYTLIHPLTFIGTLDYNTWQLSLMFLSLTNATSSTFYWSVKSSIIYFLIFLVRDVGAPPL